MKQTKYEEYAHYFKDHKAECVLSNDDFLIIDWRHQSGRSDYYVRYILDIQRGSLIIQGDLGDCIACWYNPVTPRNMKHYINDEHYFITKLQCSSDKYSYNWDDVRDDIYEYRDEYYLKDCDDEAEKAKITQQFEDILEALEDDDYDGTQRYSDSVVRRMAAVDTDWWDGILAHPGRRISGRVYLWIIGYQMACDQLGI